MIDYGSAAPVAVDDGSAALVPDATRYKRMWAGRYPHEAAAAFLRARRAGMTPARALVVGQIASYKDCWKFQRSLAKILGVSIRTVQRAIAQAKKLGLILVYRCKKKEKPPELDHHLWCGWSHRLTAGWGLAGEAIKRAVFEARVRFASRAALRAERNRAPTLHRAATTAPEVEPRPVRVISPEEASAMLAEMAPRISARLKAELERRYKIPRYGPPDE